MHEQREQEMLFNLLLKMIYQAVLQVLGASAADFGLLRELLFLVGNECVWDACPHMYFDTSRCFQASLDVSLMRADLVCT